MARTLGNVKFGSNLEVTGQGILDARLTVRTKSDLYLYTETGNNYYDKMVVTVEDEDAQYMLVDSSKLTEAAGWKLISTTLIFEEGGKLNANEVGLKVVTAETTNENIAYSYKLVDSKGADVTGSSLIEIPKDRHLHKVYLGKTDDTVNTTTGVETTATTGDDALNFIYQLANGDYSLVSINVAEFLKEAEFPSEDFDVKNGKVYLDRGVVKTLTVNGEEATMANGETNDHALTVTINGSHIAVSGTDATKLNDKLAELEEKFDADDGMFGDGLKYNTTTNKYDVTIADALKDTLQVTEDGITWAENPVIDCGTYGDE